MSFTSYRPIEPMIISMFTGKEDAFYEIAAYLQRRYISIERRLVDTFRFVDCNASNQETYSYEYSSILRDTGSVFGSAMDKLVRATTSVTGETTIRDYKRWLLGINIPNTKRATSFSKISAVSVDINYPSNTVKVLIPFLSLISEESRLDWWTAYNNIKHSDFERFNEGNLKNSMNAVAALAILLALCSETRGNFFVAAIYQPENFRLKAQFFQ